MYCNSYSFSAEPCSGRVANRLGLHTLPVTFSYIHIWIFHSRFPYLHSLRLHSRNERSAGPQFPRKDCEEYYL